MTMEHDPQPGRPGAEPREARSLPDLVTDLVQQVTTLFRTEIALLKAEMRENLGRVGTGAAEIGAGAMIIQAALIILLIALVHAIEALGIGFGWASLIVGVVFAAIGALLLKRGKDNMSPTGLAPERTQRSLEKDVNLVKEEVR